MALSIFEEKSKIPTEADLESALGSTYEVWNEIKKFTLDLREDFFEEWNFAGKNYGWSFRIKDKKRAIIYLIPNSGFFKVAFVLGEKSVIETNSTDIDLGIKEVINSAKKYAEGRGFRIDVRNSALLNDIKKIIEIKIKK